MRPEDPVEKTNTTSTPRPRMTAALVLRLLILNDRLTDGTRNGRAEMHVGPIDPIAGVEAEAGVAAATEIRMTSIVFRGFKRSLPPARRAERLSHGRTAPVAAKKNASETGTETETETPDGGIVTAIVTEIVIATVTEKEKESVTATETATGIAIDTVSAKKTAIATGTETASGIGIGNALGATELSPLLTVTIPLVTIPDVLSETARTAATGTKTAPEIKHQPRPPSPRRIPIRWSVRLVIANECLRSSSGGKQ
jgi:hypothetical protein